jgi:hypothetical protein
MRRHSIAMLVALIALPTIAFAQSTTQPVAPAAAGPTLAAPAAAAAPSGGRADTPEAKARYEKFRAACGTDLQKHCATVQRGTEQSRDEMRQCIETHKASFSSTCQAALAEREAAREARKQGQAPAAAIEKPKS